MKRAQMGTVLTTGEVARSLSQGKMVEIQAIQIKLATKGKDSMK